MAPRTRSSKSSTTVALPKAKPLKKTTSKKAVVKKNTPGASKASTSRMPRKMILPESSEDERVVVAEVPLVQPNEPEDNSSASLELVAEKLEKEMAEEELRDEQEGEKERLEEEAVKEDAVDPDSVVDDVLKAIHIEVQEADQPEPQEEGQ